MRLLFQKVAVFNAESEADELDDVSHNQWTNISDSPSFIIGEQVRVMNGGVQTGPSGFRPFWPVSYTTLNL